LLRSFIESKIANVKASMSDGSWQRILSITWPAFIELVLSTLFGMVDMVMVGRLRSAAITAVGLTNQPFLLLLAIFAAANVGTTTLVAWNIGAKDKERAVYVTRQTLVINFVLGIVMSLVGIVFARRTMLFMGAGPDVIDDATAYFQIVSAGLVFQAVSMGITAALRGAGETRWPMYYNLGSNFFNVFGNYVLIFGKFGFPRWEVTGAAVSTTFSRFLACSVGIYLLFFSKRSMLSTSLRGRYLPDPAIIKRIFSIGIPSALEQFVLRTGLMLFARTVSGLGTDQFAAHQIGLNISGLTFSPSMAFGVAATTLVGQSLGADEPETAEKHANTVHHMALAVSAIMGMVFLLFSHPMARIYTNDLAVAAAAGTVLKLLALAQPGQSTQLSLAGALRGAGDTMYPLYASAFGIWIFRVVVAYIFVEIFHWGLIGAWLSLLLDQYTRAAVVYFRFRSGKWKYMRSRTREAKKTEETYA